MILEKKNIDNIFLIAVLVGTLYVVYLLLRPFLTVIIISAVLVTIFYGLYEKLTAKLKGHRSLAALIMVILIALVIILPTTDFLIYLSQKSIEGFSSVTTWINSGALERTVNSNQFSKTFNFINPNVFNLRQYLISVSSQISNFLISGGTTIVRSTTEFITSLILMLFTMYFLFRDGKEMLGKLMYWTPLSNKYDKIIFKKFSDVSYSTIISTFVSAIVQGVICAIGFAIVGIPAFFIGIATAFVALLPYVGSALIWIPTGIYLLLTGQIWQGIFILIWGVVVVSVVDNILRPMMIKGKAEVHPLLIFFSIFGGILLFGFWGMIIGPIMISIAFTLLHIYELESENVLEK